MYENFTHSARKVMQAANQEACRLGHEGIEPEHILLGIAGGFDNMARSILAAYTCLHDVRIHFEQAIPSGPHNYMGKLPQTPRAQKVIELAIEKAGDETNSFVGTGHILLGILHEQGNIVIKTLKHFNIDPEKLKKQISFELKGI